MGLNIENTNIGYVLGRLFATAEALKEQLYNKGISSNKFENLFNAPKIGFSTLIIEHQKNILKAKNNYYTKITEEILNKIDDIPEQLNSEEQQFIMLGYYHQKYVLCKHGASCELTT